MIELTTAEIRTLIEARDILYAKLIPGRHYLVELAHSAVLDVLHHGVLMAKIRAVSDE